MKFSPVAPFIFAVGILSAGLFSGDFILKHFSWSGRLLSGNAVQISNPYGNVQASTAPAAELSVSGMIQKLDRDQQDIDIRVDQVGRGIVVRVTHAREGQSSSQAFQGRVDLSLLIPDGVHLEVSTRSGSVDLRNITGNMKVTTASGRIQVAGSGAVQAKSEAGEIDVALTGTAWKTPLLLQSGLGDVKVAFPDSASLLFAAETSGPIRLDFPAGIQVSRGSTTASASFGHGGQQLRLVSTSGAVEATALGAKTSQASKPTVHQGDLRDLPKHEGWKPGDPIIEIPKKVKPKPPKPPSFFERQGASRHGRLPSTGSAL